MLFQATQLVDRVCEVAETFLLTVEAASRVAASRRKGPSSSSGPASPAAMGQLMKRATSLASVLTTLMRTLRVFN